MSFAADTKVRALQNKFAYMTVVLKQNVTAFYCLQSSSHLEVLLLAPNIEKLLCAWRI